MSSFGGLFLGLVSFPGEASLVLLCGPDFVVLEVEKEVGIPLF